MGLLEQKDRLKNVLDGIKEAESQVANSRDQSSDRPIDFSWVRMVAML